LISDILTPGEIGRLELRRVLSLLHLIIPLRDSPLTPPRGVVFAAKFNMWCDITTGQSCQAHDRRGSGNGLIIPPTEVPHNIRESLTAH